MNRFKASALIALFIQGILLAGEAPLCSSSEVRLSLKPIFCIEEDISGGLLDIPEVGLNLEDLQAIFDGAESSGGHGISPMNRPVINARRSLVIEGTIDCEVELLTDGGKRVSFLSYQDIRLSSQAPVSHLKYGFWNHGLTTSGFDWVSVAVAPIVGIAHYFVEAYSQDDKTSLMVCSRDSGSNICVEGDFEESTLASSLILRQVTKVPYLLRELKVSCQIR